MKKMLVFVGALTLSTPVNADKSVWESCSNALASIYYMSLASAPIEAINWRYDYELNKYYVDISIFQSDVAKIYEYVGFNKIMNEIVTEPSSMKTFERIRDVMCGSKLHSDDPAIREKLSKSYRAQ